MIWSGIRTVEAKEKNEREMCFWLFIFALIVVVFACLCFVDVVPVIRQMAQ